MSLKPINGGVILIVGAKASNLSDELRNHPRIITWDSQNQNWIHKDIPANARAIFLTRFIGHTVFAKLQSLARKRQIPIFNPDGTGMIVKQVKELLDIQPKVTEMTPTNSVNESTNEVNRGKLKPLVELIDPALSNVANAKVLLEKAKELGINTTEASLAQMVSTHRRKSGVTAVPKSIQSKLDVSVDMLDTMIKELSDMREYLIAITEENRLLKLKVDRFKKALEE